MRSLFVVLAVWVFAAARAEAPFDLNTPSPTYWTWQVPGEESPVVITIGAGLLNYVMACYRSYPVEFNAGALRVHPAWHWTSQCTPHDRKAATVFLRALRAAQKVERSAGRLNFRDNTGAVHLSLARFDPPALEYRYWHVTAYRRGDVMVTPLAREHGSDGKLLDAPLPLVIFALGGLDGGVGCGGLVGGYHYSGVSLTLEASSILAGWCPPEAEQQNQAILDVLNAVRSVKRVDGGFHFFDARAELVAVLRP